MPTFYRVQTAETEQLQQKYMMLMSNQLLDSKNKKSRRPFGRLPRLLYMKKSVFYISAAAVVSFGADVASPL